MWEDPKGVGVVDKKWNIPRGQRIFSHLHVRFSILLLLGVVYLPFFFYRTTSKKFVEFGKFLQRLQNASVLDDLTAPVSSASFAEFFDERQ